MDYEYVENSITTRIKYSLPESIKNKFPDISVENELKTTSQGFPNVYCHELAGVEKDETLAGNKINNMLYSMQIEINSNTTKSDARMVMYAVMDIMKKMSFTAFSMPLYSKNGNIHTYTARFRRNLSPDDII